MTLGDLIHRYRTDNKINMQEFANACGLSKAYISILERNHNPKSGKPPIPTLETIQAVGKVIGVGFNDLLAMLDRDQEVALSPLPANLIPVSFKKIPLLGQIACGQPLLAQEHIEDYIDLPGHIHADFALACKGDSMIDAGIQDGDMVYIRSQPAVETGQIAAVMVDGDEATLKRFYATSDTVQLVAANPKYPPMMFVGEEINTRLRVLGLAVAFTHPLLGE